MPWRGCCWRPACCTWPSSTSCPRSRCSWSRCRPGPWARATSRPGTFGIYPEQIAKYWDEFVRSIVYGGLATLLCLALGFPLAYFIAFRGGRYKSLLLFLIIAPFFTSFLLRTLSWKIIFADNGMILGPLKDIGLLPESFRLLATPIAVIAGITYNFLPFMTLPLYVALEKMPVSILEASADLYAGTAARFLAGHLPDGPAGRRGGVAADVHPRGR